MTRHVAVISILLAVAAGCNENAAHARVAEARRLSDSLGVQFGQAVEAGNRAVMADTDQVAAASALEARAATDAVQDQATALALALKSLGYATEAGLLNEFQRRFEEYRTLESDILALAVEGTNLKAQRLSFGSVQKAADDFRDALDRVVAANPAADAWRLKALVSTALAGAREIQVLQAPHIAEADDNAMTRLEARMTVAETTARAALTDLGKVASASSQTQVAAATDALDRLSTLNTEVTALSRRNTNVRSLALALGLKRTLTASCDTAVRALQTALDARGLPSR